MEPERNPDHESEKRSLVDELRERGHDEMADRIEEYRLAEQRRARSRKRKRKQQKRSRRRNR